MVDIQGSEEQDRGNLGQDVYERYEDDNLHSILGIRSVGSSSHGTRTSSRLDVQCPRENILPVESN